MSTLNNLLNKTSQATARAAQKAEETVKEKKSSGASRAVGFIGKQAGDQATKIELQKLREKHGMAVSLKVSDIKVDPSRMRHLPVSDYEKLKQRIIAEGVTQPIIVEIDQDGNPWLVAGHHRHKICTEIGKEEIPAIIQKYGSALERDLAGYRSNQNVLLSTFEQYKFLTQFKETHSYTQEKLAEVCGYSSGFVSDMLSLSKLPADLVEIIAQSGLFLSQHNLAALRNCALENTDKPDQVRAIFEEFLLSPEQKNLSGCIAKHLSSASDAQPKFIPEKVSITHKGVDIGSFKIEKKKITFSCKEDISVELADKIQDLIQSHFNN